MRRAKKGMAMLSVLFAMAVFMLFGTLITTNTLNASVSVKGMVQKTENRNKLGEIGDCFVAEAKKNVQRYGKRDIGRGTCGNACHSVGK